MIGIICAMKREFDQIKFLMSDIVLEKRGIFNTAIGEIENTKCVVMECGVGKVNAAMGAEFMICSYNPDIVLNVGVAGSLDENINIGDIVVATDCIQHDFDISAFLHRKKGEIPGINEVKITCTPEIVLKLEQCAKEFDNINFHSGIILTGDQFIESSEKSSRLKAEFGGIACEMEGASIAQVCFLNGVKFGITRAISDGASTIDFESFVESSSRNAAHLIRSFIKLLRD